MMKRFVLMSGFFLAFGISSLAQQNTLAPGENLLVDGVPGIPEALAEKIGGYTENRDALQTDWHPTRREMLIGARFGRDTDDHVVRRETYPVTIQNGVFENITEISGNSFEGKGGSGIIISGMDLPSARP